MTRISRTSRIGSRRQRRNAGNTRMAVSKQTVRSIAEGRIARDFDVLRLPKQLIPNVTESTIKVTQSFMGTFDISGQTTGPSYRGFSPSDLFALVPGGSTYWSRGRIEKVTVFLKPDASQALTTNTGRIIEELQVQIPGDDTGSPPTTLRDNAIDGQTLPSISWKYGLNQRMKWLNPANTDNIFTVSLPSTQSEPASLTHKIYVVVTFELISPQLAN